MSIGTSRSRPPSPPFTPEDLPKPGPGDLDFDDPPNHMPEIIKIFYTLSPIVREVVKNEGKGKPPMFCFYKGYCTHYIGQSAKIDLDEHWKQNPHHRLRNTQPWKKEKDRRKEMQEQFRKKRGSKSSRYKSPSRQREYSPRRQFDVGPSRHSRARSKSPHSDEIDRMRSSRRRSRSRRRSSSRSWSPNRNKPSPRRSPSIGRRRSPRRLSPSPARSHYRDKSPLRSSSSRDYRSRRSPSPPRRDISLNNKYNRMGPRNYPTRPPPIGRYNSRKERDDSPVRTEFECKHCNLIIHGQENYSEHHQQRVRNKMHCPPPPLAPEPEQREKGHCKKCNKEFPLHVLRDHISKCAEKLDLRSRTRSHDSESSSPSPPRISTAKSRSPSPAKASKSIGEPPSEVKSEKRPNHPTESSNTDPIIITLDDSSGSDMNISAGEASPPKSPVVLQEPSVTSSKVATPSPPPVSPPHSTNVSPPRGMAMPNVQVTPDGSLVHIFDSGPEETPGNYIPMPCPPVHASNVFARQWSCPEQREITQPRSSMFMEPPPPLSLPPPVPLRNSSHHSLPTNLPAYPIDRQSAKTVHQPVLPPVFQRQVSLPAPNPRDPRKLLKPKPKIRIVAEAKLQEENIATPSDTLFHPKPWPANSTTQAPLLESPTTEVLMSMPSVNYGPTPTALFNKLPTQPAPISKPKDPRLDRISRTSPLSESPDQSSPRESLGRADTPLSPQVTQAERPPLLRRQPSETIGDIMSSISKVTELDRSSQNLKLMNRGKEVEKISQRHDGKVLNRIETSRPDNVEKALKLPAAILEEKVKEDPPMPKPISIVEKHQAEQSKLDDIFDKKKARMKTVSTVAVSRRKPSGDRSLSELVDTESAKNVEKLTKVSPPTTKKQTVVTIPTGSKSDATKKKEGDKLSSTENVKKKCTDSNKSPEVVGSKGIESENSSVLKTTHAKRRNDSNLKTSKVKSSTGKSGGKSSHLKTSEKIKTFEDALRTDENAPSKDKKKTKKSSREKESRAASLEPKPSSSSKLKRKRLWGDELSIGEEKNKADEKNKSASNSKGNVERKSKEKEVTEKFNKATKNNNKSEKDLQSVTKTLKRKREDEPSISPVEKEKKKIKTNVHSKIKVKEKEVEKGKENGKYMAKSNERIERRIEKDKVTQSCKDLEEKETEKMFKDNELLDNSSWKVNPDNKNTIGQENEVSVEHLSVETAVSVAHLSEENVESVAEVIPAKLVADNSVPVSSVDILDGSQETNVEDSLVNTSQIRNEEQVECTSTSGVMEDVDVLQEKSCDKNVDSLQVKLSIDNVSTTELIESSFPRATSTSNIERSESESREAAKENVVTSSSSSTCISVVVRFVDDEGVDEVESITSTTKIQDDPSEHYSSGRRGRSPKNQTKSQNKFRRIALFEDESSETEDINCNPPCNPSAIIESSQNDRSNEESVQNSVVKMWEKNKKLGSSGKVVSLMDALGMDEEVAMDMDTDKEDVIFLSLNDDCSKCPRCDVKWDTFRQTFNIVTGEVIQDCQHCYVTAKIRTHDSFPLHCAPCCQ